MEKEKNNIGLIVLIIMLILIILGLIGFIGYDKVYSDKKINKEYSTTNTTKKIPKEEHNSTILNDNSILIYSANNNGLDLFYAVIKNENLYYFQEKKGNNYSNSNSSRWSSDFSNNYDLESENTFIKYDNLTNIKRIKKFNIGTSVNPHLYAITNDGKVFYGPIFENDMLILEEEPLLKDYEIEDILEQNGEMNKDYTVLLKDGTEKNIVEEN